MAASDVALIPLGELGDLFQGLPHRFAAAKAPPDAPAFALLSIGDVTELTVTPPDVEPTPLPCDVPRQYVLQPGDVLTQEISASNSGKAALRGAGINVPVPRGTFYLGGATPSSNRWQTQFSFDGGKTFGSAPLMRTVTVSENGKSVQKKVVVPPSEYTNVRWLVAAIQPDETLKLGFRVKVK